MRSPKELALNSFSRLTLFERASRRFGLLIWIFITSVGCQAKTNSQVAQSYSPNDLLILSETFGQGNDGDLLRPQEEDELLLIRYLESLNERYTLNPKPTSIRLDSGVDHRRVIVSTEFEVTLPQGWARSIPVRYTTDVLLGSPGHPEPNEKTVIYYLEDQSVEWLKATSFAQVPRKEIRRDDEGWRIECKEKFATSYLVVPKGYKDEILTACTRWVTLTSAPGSRPVYWYGSPDVEDLLHELNLVLTELKMTGHRFEVHHDNWTSLRKRKVLRIASERSPFTYFLERGQEKGLAFELLSWFSKDWKLRTEVYPVDSREAGIELLEAGQADLLLTLDSGLVFAKDALVTQPFHESSLTQLKISGSSGDAAYDASLAHEVLQPLLRELESQSETRYSGVRWDNALELFKSGSIASYLTVAPMSKWLKGQLASLEVEPVEQASNAITSDWVFAVRKSAIGLKEALDQFVNRERGTLTWNVIRNKYLRSAHRSLLHNESEIYARSSIPYETSFRKYASAYGLDWRLVAAQAAVESDFNPKAVSWVGARGILQVMPATATELGIENLHSVANGLQAGVRYLDWLTERFESSLDYRQRLRFALASYNIGLGHVRDARRLADSLGLDRNRWFGNVEKAMLKLREPKYYKASRHGYCRGGEAVAYVSKIQKLYDVYVQAYEP